MTVTLDKDKFDQHGRKFRLHFKGASDPACGVSSDAGADGALAITSNYNACGINLAINDGEVSYSQTVLVTYGMTANSIVQRQEVISFEVSCTVDASVAVGLAGAGHVNVSSLEEQTIAKCKQPQVYFLFVTLEKGILSFFIYLTSIFVQLSSALSVRNFDLKLSWRLKLCAKVFNQVPFSMIKPFLFDHFSRSQ